jgi:membrane associated rhomboid family serine protease
MIYDRSYMQQPTGSNKKSTSMVNLLLFITIGVFILQQILNVFFPGRGGQNYFMADWFALNINNFKELKVWTLLTYSFLHSTQGIFHILGNMLGLFFVGRFIEPVIGKRDLLALYLGGGLFGGLLFLAVHLNDPTMVVGASASVLALVSFFCLLKPEERITLLLFFIIPITVKPKWLFWGLLGYSIFGVLFYELLGQGQSMLAIAHSAHLGGIAAGAAYYLFVHKRFGSLFSTAHSKPSVELPHWFKKKQQTEPLISYKVNRSRPDNLQKEVDRILDKINDSGFGSLNASEKATLDQARDILRK